MKAPAAWMALPAISRGTILMFLSSMCYALTFVTIKKLGDSFSVYQLVLFRTFLGTVVIRRTKLTGPAEEATRRTRDHVVPLIEGRPGFRGYCAFVVERGEVPAQRDVARIGQVTDLPDADNVTAE